MRVIADHVRTLTFAIGDGALPSNEGRGYVLRRILRRAARFGRNLGMHEPFIYQLVPTLVETMSYIFPEIKTQQEHIQKVIKGEEESFNATLDNGLKIFEELITKPETQTSKAISGEDAFKLYDTFGFPLDLTELMANEHGLKVDVSMFTRLMEEQKQRSKPKRSIHLGLYGHDADIWASQTKGPDFVYDIPWVETNIEFETTELLPSEKDKQFKGVILQKTNFYSESGGQVSDLGNIEIDFPDGKKEIVEVKEVKKRNDRTIHIINWHDAIPKEAKIKTLIDQSRRLSIARNHSATHLLHNALRRILGTHVHQAGSLVAPDYLRFDFAHFTKLSDQELADIEALVNEKIKESIPRTPGLNNIPFEDAKKMGALMFFGDKYGERVNVIQFGDFDTEFCGGTHVNNTGEIGYFKICERAALQAAQGVSLR